LFLELRRFPVPFKLNRDRRHQLGGSWMGWILRLVDTGIDSPPRVVDVINLRSFGDLGDIAKLGLTLSEAKQTLARLQQVVIAVQADDHAVLRPDCSSCGQAC